MTSPPVQLIHQSSSHEVVQVLTGLLEVARAGQMNGIIFGASFGGAKFFVDAAGTLHRNPVTALGVSAMLTAELEHRIRHKATDTLI